MDFDALLFDCDGVLVDSEAITNGVLRDMLEELGWTLTLDECMCLFVGRSLKDETAIILARTGKAVDEAWQEAFRARRNAALAREVGPIRGAVDAVAALHARFAGRIAVCSGADRPKVELQLARCGLPRFFEGRVFSGCEMARSKPFPDVYLAAVKALGVTAGRCLVIEDTVTGVQAGVAAGTTVWGYSPPEAGHDAPAALRAAGAGRVFDDMAQLPRLLGGWRGRPQARSAVAPRRDGFIGSGSFLVHDGPDAFAWRSSRPEAVTATLTWVAFALAVAAWLVHYRLAAVRLPRLDFNPSPFNAALLARLDQLRRPYAPTPWLYNAHLQLLWLLLRGAVAPPLRYERTDVLRMRDGGTTALDWLGLDGDATAPTLVVLPSITGDAQSMRSIVADLRRATGWRIVVCTRRGHGGLALTAPVLNTMGCTQDLREQLATIHAQVPGSPLYAIGVSAGSALLVRYLGEEGPRSLVRAGVAYCPGYDIGVAWGRVPPFYSRLMTRRLKQHFLEQHAPALAHLGTFDACLATRDLTGFHEHLYELAGCTDLADYLARSNPMAVFDTVAVPVLVINADDDPVCVQANAHDHVDAIRAVPDALMVRTARGSHCAFLEGWPARSWGNRLMADYLLAAVAVQREREHVNATQEPCKL